MKGKERDLGSVVYEVSIGFYVDYETRDKGAALAEAERFVRQDPEAHIMVHKVWRDSHNLVPEESKLIFDSKNPNLPRKAGAEG